MKLRIFFALLLIVLIIPPSTSALVINEFVPNANPEWVEFYNNDATTTDLSNYYFDDDTDFNSDSGSSSKIALSGLLNSGQTCFRDLSTMLNNDGDTPTLFKADSTLVDSYNYASSSAGLSYSRVPDGAEWMVAQTPTKSTQNCQDLAPTSTPVPPTSTPIPPTPNPTPTPTVAPVPTKKPTPTPTGIVSLIPSIGPQEFVNAQQNSQGQLLNLNDSPPPSNTPSVLGESNVKSNSFWPILIIGVGALGLIVSLILLFYHSRKETSLSDPII